MEWKMIFPVHERREMAVRAWREIRNRCGTELLDEGKFFTVMINLSAFVTYLHSENHSQRKVIKFGAIEDTVLEKPTTKPFIEQPLESWLTEIMPE